MVTRITSTYNYTKVTNMGGLEYYFTTSVQDYPPLTLVPPPREYLPDRGQGNHYSRTSQVHTKPTNFLSPWRGMRDRTRMRAVHYVTEEGIEDLLAFEGLQEWSTSVVVIQKTCRTSRCPVLFCTKVIFNKLESKKKENIFVFLTDCVYTCSVGGLIRHGRFTVRVTNVSKKQQKGNVTYRTPTKHRVRRYHGVVSGYCDWTFTTKTSHGG